MARTPSPFPSPSVAVALRRTLLGASLALLGVAAQAGEIAVIVKTTNSSFWQNVNKGASARMPRSSRSTATR